MMTMKFKLFLAALLAAVFLLVSACGQKGPLYLPEDEAGATQAGESDEQQEDEEGDDSNASSG